MSKEALLTYAAPPGSISTLEQLAEILTRAKDHPVKVYSVLSSGFGLYTRYFTKNSILDKNENCYYFSSPNDEYGGILIRIYNEKQRERAIFENYWLARAYHLKLGGKVELNPMVQLRTQQNWNQ